MMCSSVERLTGLTPPESPPGMMVKDRQVGRQTDKHTGRHEAETGETLATMKAKLKLSLFYSCILDHGPPFDLLLYCTVYFLRLQLAIIFIIN